jgi:hypothetical protein
MNAFARPLLLVFAGSVIALLIGAGVIMTTVVTAAGPASPNYAYATIGGVQYHALADRPIDPSNPVDAKLIRGLPPRDRRLPKGQMLLGAFLTTTNGSRTQAARTASRIGLRDEAQHSYSPLRLPAANPFAYSARTLAPGAVDPSTGTAAAGDLAAGGRLLLFRVPAFQYLNGQFELVVHDPQHPGTSGYVQF